MTGLGEISDNERERIHLICVAIWIASRKVDRLHEEQINQHVDIGLRESIMEGRRLDAAIKRAVRPIRQLISRQRQHLVGEQFRRTDVRHLID